MDHVMIDLSSMLSEDLIFDNILYIFDQVQRDCYNNFPKKLLIRHDQYAPLKTMKFSNYGEITTFKSYYWMTPVGEFELIFRDTR